MLEANGRGVQIYTCKSADTGMKWAFTGPEAKLLDADGKQIGTHFAGPTWKLTDNSQIQGEVVATKPAPDPGSVPSLLLKAKAGTATGKLADVAFIQRSETHGGVAPATGCASAADSGKTARVDYSAKYTFYAAAQ